MEAEGQLRRSGDTAPGGHEIIGAGFGVMVHGLIVIVAGNPDIGDILISKDALHHDVDATIFGYRPGEVPQLGCREFIADEHLAQVAVSTCKEVNPDIHVHTGRVVSGDQFISSKEVKTRLIQEFQGDCAEMEGASIAHGAYLNDIPFVIIRAISDKADDSAEMDYPTFEKAAALHSAKLVEAMMPRI
jgi:adenosylhomocysteine nucleosidase